MCMTGIWLVQIIVLAIPGQPGGWPLHFVLIMRLFRMWRVVKFLEVRHSLTVFQSVSKQTHSPADAA